MAGWFSLFLCILGFAALALAMPRHYEQLLFRKPAAGRQWVWRLLALVLLGLSVGLACMAWDMRSLPSQPGSEWRLRPLLRLQSH